LPHPVDELQNEIPPSCLQLACNGTLRGPSEERVEPGLEAVVFVLSLSGMAEGSFNGLKGPLRLAPKSAFAAAVNGYYQLSVDIEEPGLSVFRCFGGRLSLG